MLEMVLDLIGQCGDEIQAIGIDAWGIDFGIVNKEGELIERPGNYRDPIFLEAHKELQERLPDYNLYQNTGNQVLPFLTICQLNEMRLNRPASFEQIHKILFLPDLIQYYLTGNMVCDETMLATSGFYNIKTHRLSNENLRAIGISKEQFPEIVKPGHYTGNTSGALIESLRHYNIDVYSVCGHDMAGAALAAEAFYNRDTVFINAGTWALIGAVNRKTVCSEAAYREKITNEIGYGGDEIILKNITGFYLLEKYKRQMEERRGEKISFDEIRKHILEDQNAYDILDMNDDIFTRETFDVKKTIDQYLTDHGCMGRHPEDAFGYYKLIYHSMAETYRKAILSISECTGVRYKKLNLMGGGSKSEYFSDLIERKLDMTVQKGPGEATILGNALVIFKELGEIQDIQEGQKILKESGFIM